MAANTPESDDALLDAIAAKAEQDRIDALERAIDDTPGATMTEGQRALVGVACALINVTLLMVLIRGELSAPVLLVTLGLMCALAVVNVCLTFERRS